MKKYKNVGVLCCVFFVAILLQAWVPNSTVQKLYWDKTNALQWGYFSNSNSKSGEAAMSSIAIATHSTADKNKAVVTVRAEFNINKSWVRKDCKTAYILNHEQLHYDIAELFARKLRKELAESTISYRSFSSTYDAVFNRIVAEHKAYQQRYDDETNHSIIEEQQVVWNNNVKAALDSLSGYANPTLTIQFE